MSKDEIKYEITKALDSLPDKALEDLLSYLKSLDKQADKSPLSNNLEKVLFEDKELLAKLAK
jgi:hypothetical protein